MLDDVILNKREIIQEELGDLGLGEAFLDLTADVGSRKGRA